MRGLGSGQLVEVSAARTAPQQRVLFTRVVNPPRRAVAGGSQGPDAARHSPPRLDASCCRRKYPGAARNNQGIDKRHLLNRGRNQAASAAREREGGMVGSRGASLWGECGEEERSRGRSSCGVNSPCLVPSHLLPLPFVHLAELGLGCFLDKVPALARLERHALPELILRDPESVFSSWRAHVLPSFDREDANREQRSPAPESTCQPELSRSSELRGGRRFSSRRKTGSLSSCTCTVPIWGAPAGRLGDGSPRGCFVTTTPERSFARSSRSARPRW